MTDRESSDVDSRLHSWWPRPQLTCRLRGHSVRRMTPLHEPLSGYSELWTLCDVDENHDRVKRISTYDL